MTELPEDIVLRASEIGKCYLLKDAVDATVVDRRIEHGLFKAIDNISFDVFKGDVIGVIGRNGSGKSTLLKILGEIIHPSSGTLSYKGRLMSILDIGSGFHPELSGRENAFMYGAMLGIPKQEVRQRMSQIIEFSGIGSYFDEPVKYYSNGMYLRVAFAVAFFTNTDILVLDEVLAVGDAEFMIKCHQRIREMIGAGLSIILVSHSMSDIIGLCNKCIWLDKGKLIKSGSATDVVGAYLQSGWGALESDKQKSVTSIIWAEDKCPHAHGFFLRAVSVKNISDSEPKGEALDYNFPIRIECVFSTPLSGQNFSIVLILIDQYNVPIILSTHHFQQDNGFDEHQFNPGKYISYCTIPAQLLNVGAYKLQLRVIKDNLTEILDLPGLLMFKITSPFPRQNNALMATPITLASHLDWRTEALSG
jgi:lipopolysaccharide transport system ATP-binding protein